MICDRCQAEGEEEAMRYLDIKADGPLKDGSFVLTVNDVEVPFHVRGGELLVPHICEPCWVLMGEPVGSVA